MLFNNQLSIWPGFFAPKNNELSTGFINQIVTETVLIHVAVQKSNVRIKISPGVVSFARAAPAVEGARLTKW
jgi:hypothetical protein